MVGYSFVLDRPADFRSADVVAGRVVVRAIRPAIGRSASATFTGTGTSDILWYNASNGDTDEWLINNGQWAGSVDLAPIRAHSRSPASAT